MIASYKRYFMIFFLAVVPLFIIGSFFWFKSEYINPYQDYKRLTFRDSISSNIKVTQVFKGDTYLVSADSSLWIIDDLRFNELEFKNLVYKADSIMKKADSDVVVLFVGGNKIPFKIM